MAFLFTSTTIVATTVATIVAINVTCIVSIYNKKQFLIIYSLFVLRSLTFYLRETYHYML